MHSATPPKRERWNLLSLLAVRPKDRGPRPLSPTKEERRRRRGWTPILDCLARGHRPPAVKQSPGGPPFLFLDTSSAGGWGKVTTCVESANLPVWDISTFAAFLLCSVPFKKPPRVVSRRHLLQPSDGLTSVKKRSVYFPPKHANHLFGLSPAEVFALPN